MPKVYPSWDLEEFMQGAEGAFHGFNSAFNNQATAPPMSVVGVHID